MDKKSDHIKSQTKKDKKGSVKKFSVSRETKKDVNQKGNDDKHEEKKEPIPIVQNSKTCQSTKTVTDGRIKSNTFILSENVIFEVEQRYSVKGIIGHGAYGTVCSGVDLRTKKPVAIKKVQKIFQHRSLARRTLRELIFLRCFNHENIMNLHRVMRPNRERIASLYMVCEYMETDLAMVIRSPQALSDDHCQFFLYQVLRGLKYIHSASVMHRDLKPRNLLVNSNCDLKICDFGLGRVIPNNIRIRMSDYIATRWYRAPEVILSREKYTSAIDIWAVGCILAELLLRRPLFPGKDSFHQLSLIISIIGCPKVEAKLDGLNKKRSSRSGKKGRSFLRALPKKKGKPLSEIVPNASTIALDLLTKLLSFDPTKRPSVEEALKHPYFEELHFEDDEPICTTLNISDFDFELMKTSTSDLQDLIRREIVENYPEEHFHPTSPIVHFSKAKTLPSRRRSFP